MVWFETLCQDLRYAFRLLRKAPGFTAVAVLSLAFGIGANSAMYSVVYAVLLRPLPYPEPERLVRVEQRETQDQVSMPELEFCAEHSSALASVAGARGPADGLLITDHPVWIQAMPVTAGFFHTLGIALALGREFDPQETRPGGPLAMIVSHGLWQRAFGADPNVVGRSVTLNNASYRIVGVLKEAFWFPTAADAYLPLRSSGSGSDLGANTEMIARLKPGVTLAQARGEMAILAEDFRRASPDSENYRGLALTPYQDFLAGSVRTNLLLLSGAVGVLFLIACFNLASLLLARLVARQKEIATRVALGGSRSRLLRQFLVENTLLTAAGGVTGLAGGRVLLNLLLTAVPFHLPASTTIHMEGNVIAFALIIALATGFVFSLLPAFSASHLDLHKALKTAGQAAAGTMRQRIRNVLVVGEIALSVTLLAGAGLLIQSLYNLHRQRLGFDPDGVMTFSTPVMAREGRSAAAIRAFDSALLERLRNLPEVRNAAAVNVLPLTGQNNFPTEREGHPDQDIGGMEIRVITPSYLETMKISVILGRPFNAGDIAGAPQVALVNETVARRWWGNGNPLGDRIVVGRMNGKPIGGSDEPPRIVAGVVADTRSVYLKAPPRPTVYLPVAQTPWYDNGMNWVVRGHLSPGFAEQLRHMAAGIDPRQKIDRIRTMREIISSSMADSRFDALLSGAFACLAMVLAAVGVYGLLAFAVARRTHEIGTRLALGATRPAVLKLILKQGMSLVVTGLLLGLAGALAVTRSLATLLFGVKATDPVNFAAVAALMLSIGLLASYIPARRATRVDPIVALRDE